MPLMFVYQSVPNIQAFGKETQDFYFVPALSGVSLLHISFRITCPGC